MIRRYLLGVAYALGEQQLSCSQIAGFEDAVKAHRLPPAPELMGLGSIFVTSNIFERVSESVGYTIQRAGVTVSDIDHVIFASSHFKLPFLERNRALGNVLERWNIAPRTIRGISGSGCADVLSSVDLACTMVDRGVARNVLVMGMESFAGADQARVLSYAVLSDAAVSMIVSGEPAAVNGAPTFEIVATSLTCIASEIGKGMSITSTSPDRNFVRNLLRESGTEPASITKILGNNLFLPVKTGREGLVGFSRRQMYLDNVRRIGHCLGCDPFINLLDCSVPGTTTQYVLYSEAEGHTGGVVLVGCAST